jgi:hypothetical protein
MSRAVLTQQRGRHLTWYLSLLRSNRKVPLMIKHSLTPFGRVACQCGYSRPTLGRYAPPYRCPSCDHVGTVRYLPTRWRPLQTLAVLAWLLVVIVWFFSTGCSSRPPVLISDAGSDGSVARADLVGFGTHSPTLTDSATEGDFDDAGTAVLGHSHRPVPDPDAAMPLALTDAASPDASDGAAASPSPCSNPCPPPSTCTLWLLRWQCH